MEGKMHVRQSAESDLDEEDLALLLGELDHRIHNLLMMMAPAGSVVPVALSVIKTRIDIRHEQPIGHSLLEVLHHAGLSRRHADRQRLT
jgi:hypothetical protein